MVEYLVHSLKVESSRPACTQILSITPPENSGGAENSTETSGTNGINFFCYMYESSLQHPHPVWVPEINVNPCNSVCTGLNIYISVLESVIL